jgi:YhcH/YjgK/YiaL family protein
MVIDSIQNFSFYSRLRPDIRKTLGFLYQTDVKNLEAGTYVWHEESVVAEFIVYKTKLYEPLAWVSHQQHIVIHYMAEGQEYVGYSPIDLCILQQKYNAVKDLARWKTSGDFISLHKDMFAIFFPRDVYQAGIMLKEPMPVKKILVKIKIDDSGN